MWTYKVFVLCFVVMVPASEIHGVTGERDVPEAALYGTASKEILTKLDKLHNKLAELELALNQERETRLAALQNVPAQHSDDQKLSVVTENQSSSSTTSPSTSDAHNEPLRSCKTNPFKTSGIYSMQPIGYTEPFLAYCEQSTLGGGWIVFQYRYDGSLPFYRNWTEYRNGFGEISKEFWLGLEHLHRLTSASPHELLVELKDFKGEYKYARYSKFEVDSEEQQYTLTKLGSYNGTAGDSFTGKGQNFTTKDRDNDFGWYNCAQHHHGAWWYNACTASNLNGRHENSNNFQNMMWYGFNNKNTGLAYSRMLIREI